jgi:hypothetical protein
VLGIADVQVDRCWVEQCRVPDVIVLLETLDFFASCSVLLMGSGLRDFTEKFHRLTENSLEACVL